MDLCHLVLQGGPGLVQIAVTNACNARCRFCNFSRVPSDAVSMADPRRLARGLASLRKRGSHYITFTGGEPLLYPHLLPSLARAGELGHHTILVTNGALLSPPLIRELREAGLDCLIISLDAASPERHDQHRGIPGLTAHIQEMLAFANLSGLSPIASVTVSRLIDDFDELLRSLQKLGFERLTFSYPLTQLRSSYLGYASHDSVAYSARELDNLFRRIIALKSRAPLKVLNSRQALVDLKNGLQGRPRRFPCLAGFKHFFVDWDLKVYRCHFLEQILGPFEEIHLAPHFRDGCDACTSECYRDASVFQYAALSLSDFLEAWRRGQWLKGLRTLLHPYNALSLADLLASRHWLSH
ncbi:MAG: radical SAM protein [Deltaproteobacteria bacterium]|nr:radical SAM protein [Deltaproteobacteria bacterium]